MSHTLAALNAILKNPITEDGQFKPVVIRFFQNIVNDRRINTGTAQPVTIAAGKISLIPGFSYYKITVQTGSSDDLDTINNGNEGDLIFFKAASDTATIVLKDGTGNILTEGSVDLSLDDLDDLAILHFDGTNWKAAIWNIG